MHFDQTFRALEHQLRHLHMALRRFRRKWNCKSAQSTSRWRSVTSSGRSSTSKMIRIDFGMIHPDRFRDFFEQNRFADPWRGDDQTALAPTEWRE